MPGTAGHPVKSGIHEPTGPSCAGSSRGIFNTPATWFYYCRFQKQLILKINKSQRCAHIWPSKWPNQCYSEAVTDLRDRRCKIIPIFSRNDMKTLIHRNATSCGLPVLQGSLQTRASQNCIWILFQLTDGAGEPQPEHPSALQDLTTGDVCLSRILQLFLAWHGGSSRGISMCCCW